jgi:pilus assembly protein Flp/PilA
MFEKLQFMAIMLVNDLRTKRDERGATAVEYGLLVALIAAVIVGIVATVGTEVRTAFQTVSNSLP